ncbi:HipA family kinase [Luteolibacter sp. Populi]|uniref:HipA family kinase n=1 Tax=Luteolibacter sp. Populi TaxID=3230487 RepID=UPI0034662683
MSARLGRFVETFRGSSFPTLAETTDGERLVIKMRGAGNGAGVLLAEFLVNRLASRCGLPVPDARVVEIAAGHPWEFGTDEFDDLLQKSAGPNQGLAWIPAARQMREDEVLALPEEMVSQIVTLDLAFANLDRTRDSGNLLLDPAGKCWIVDHGSCRFLYREGKAFPKELPVGHVFRGREELFDAGWLAGMTPELVEEVVGELPDLWLREEGISREVVVGRVGDCLGMGR